MTRRGVGERHEFTAADSVVTAIRGCDVIECPSLPGLAFLLSSTHSCSDRSAFKHQHRGAVTVVLLSGVGDVESSRGSLHEPYAIGLPAGRCGGSAWTWAGPTRASRRCKPAMVHDLDEVVEVVGILHTRSVLPPYRSINRTLKAECAVYLSD